MISLTSVFNGMAAEWVQVIPFIVDCGYRVESKSSGMQYVVRPCICKDCNILTDVCVILCMESFLKEDKLIKGMKNYFH